MSGAQKGIGSRARRRGQRVRHARRLGQLLPRRDQGIEGAGLRAALLPRGQKAPRFARSGRGGALPPARAGREAAAVAIPRCAARLLRRRPSSSLPEKSLDEYRQEIADCEHGLSECGAQLKAAAKHLPASASSCSKRRTTRTIPPCAIPRRAGTDSCG